MLLDTGFGSHAIPPDLAAEPASPPPPPSPCGAGGPTAAAAPGSPSERSRPPTATWWSWTRPPLRRAGFEVEGVRGAPPSSEPWWWSTTCAASWRSGTLDARRGRPGLAAGPHRRHGPVRPRPGPCLRGGHTAPLVPTRHGSTTPSRSPAGGAPTASRATGRPTPRSLRGHSASCAAGGGPRAWSCSPVEHGPPGGHPGPGRGAGPPLRPADQRRPPARGRRVVLDLGAQRLAIRRDGARTPLTRISKGEPGGGEERRVEAPDQDGPLTAAAAERRPRRPPRGYSLGAGHGRGLVAPPRRPFPCESSSSPSEFPIRPTAGTRSSPGGSWSASPASTR